MLLRLLASVLLGIAMFAVPAHALALDYTAPVVPPELRSDAAAPDPGSDLAPGLSAGQGTADDNPQADPGAPSYVPRSQWDNSHGGCALWDWDVC
jgi:hypothetical protein